MAASLQVAKFIEAITMCSSHYSMSINELSGKSEAMWYNPWGFPEQITTLCSPENCNYGKNRNYGNGTNSLT